MCVQEDNKKKTKRERASYLNNHCNASTIQIRALWSYLTEGVLHKSIQKAVVALGSHAAHHPWTYVIGITILSFGLAGIGFLTNFTTEFDQRVFLTPFGSYADVHSDWIYSKYQDGSGSGSGFEKVRVLWLLLHSQGDNVLHPQAIRQAIITVETLQSAPDFDNVCSQSQFLSMDTNQPTCRIFSVTEFWDHNLTLFDQQMEMQKQTPHQREDFLQNVISRGIFPDQTPVFHEVILGKYTHTNTANTSTATATATATAIGDLLTPTTNRTDDDTEIQPQPVSFRITAAQSLVIKMDIPDLGEDTDPLEQQLLVRLAHLKRKFETERTATPVQLEYFTLNAYQQEFQRAMNQDLPLVFVLALVMISFTCLVFYKHHQKVKSRALLGLFSFATIGMSLMSGYGIMFILGVPLTSVGIMIPFVVMGVALDDTFIITAAFFRNCNNRHVENENDRHNVIAIVKDTLEEVGVSISMTTLTTLLCFVIGSVTTIPAVRWLCFYAATTIGVDFIYQVTFFIALLTLDQRRIQSNRRDLCFWIVVDDEQEDNMNIISQDNNSKQTGDTDEHEVQQVQKEDADQAGSAKDDTGIDTDSQTNGENGNIIATGESTILVKALEGTGTETEVHAIAPHYLTKTVQRNPATQHSRSNSNEIHERELDQNIAERFMVWYADKLMRPWVKLIVIFVFAAYSIGCAYSTTLLHQEFNVGDYVPRDSFLTSFMEHFSSLTTVQRYVGVYFRNVDQSDPSIQEQMSDYVQGLSEMPKIGETAPFFWVRDFEKMAESELVAETLQNLGFDINIANLTFNEQLDLALNIAPIRQIYGQDIVRDPVSGNITASRTNLFLRTVDMYDIQDQIATLQEIRDITLSQPINEFGDELSFFTFDDMYFFWELYSTIVDELIFTTVTCVVVVSCVTFVLIPHWSSVAFILPLIIMLYFDLLGTMQYCGITINPISYFIIVMAIGLLVDFLMHILLRYYESEGKTREEKVKATLLDMGSSILCGGFTTWLGVIPLAFSTTKTFMTVFVSFLAMVTLGIAFGLAFLPVLLSIVGPVGKKKTYGTAAATSKSNIITTPSHSHPATDSLQQFIYNFGGKGIQLYDGEIIFEQVEV